MSRFRRSVQATCNLGARKTIIDNIVNVKVTSFSGTASHKTLISTRKLIIVTENSLLLQNNYGNRWRVVLNDKETEKTVLINFFLPLLATMIYFRCVHWVEKLIYTYKEETGKSPPEKKEIVIFIVSLWWKLPPYKNHWKLVSGEPTLRGVSERNSNLTRQSERLTTRPREAGKTTFIWTLTPLRFHAFHWSLCLYVANIIVNISKIRIVRYFAKYIVAIILNGLIFIRLNMLFRKK